MGTSPSDNGVRVFSTGSRRDRRTGKGRFDLISPVVMRALALHMETGAERYGDRNWESGQPLSVFLDSAERHLASAKEGMTNENHWVAALWNIHGLIHTKAMIERGLLPASLDDLPKYVNEGDGA